MALIPEQVRQQLKDRFDTALTGPVHLTLYTRPGSSRLILPAGVGCATCQDAREMAELLRDAAPEKVSRQSSPRSDCDRVHRGAIRERGLLKDFPRGK